MDTTEEIKDRLPIEDLVARYVDLKRSGASLKGLCPFHQEKTPSFYVSPSRGTYHCFSCGKGGDQFAFLMEMERLTFPEALKQLASQAGIPLPEREAAKPSLRGKLHEANAAAGAFFTAALGSQAGARARRYLEERGFGGEAIELFGLGFAPESRDAMTRNLQGAGFDERTLLAAGLIRQDDDGRSRDTFRGRVMFPICDLSGKVSGFGGRMLGDGQPKYLNSPQTEVFDKSSVLFGIHLAVEVIRKERRAVLVEGYLDAVRAQVAGYRNVVASLGTAVTTQQLATLTRLADTVVIALDPDPAGQAATARTSLNALAEVTRARGRTAGEAGAVDLRVARLPVELGDPDEIIRDHLEVWERAIAEAIPAFQFYFERTMALLDRNRTSWRQEAMDQLLPLFQQFAGLPGSAGWQAEWVQRLSSETGIAPGAIQRSLPGATAGPRKTVRPRQKSGEQERQVLSGTTTRALARDAGDDIESALIGLLLNLVIVPEDVLRALSDARLECPEHRAIAERLAAWRNTGNYDFEMFCETLPVDLRGVAGELRQASPPLPADDKWTVATALYLARLRHLRIVAQVTRSTELLEDMAGEDRQTVALTVAQLLTERLEVERSLDRLARQVFQAVTPGE